MGKADVIVRVVIQTNETAVEKSEMMEKWNLITLIIGRISGITN